MRVVADSKEGQKVRRVTIDNKPCINVIELDTEEGWVKVAIPVGLPTLDDARSPNVLESETPVKWEEKILRGHVEVVFED